MKLTWKRRTWLSTVLAALLLTAGSCRKDGRDAGEVKIGTILGLTGSNSAYGEKMLNGFRLAVDEVNSAGGVNGRPIRLVVEDSQFDPTKALTAYRRLTTNENVRMIVGITGSKNALAVCSAAKGEGVLILDALSSAPKLTEAGGHNYFRIMASDAFAGKYNAEWALESGMKRPYIVYQEDDWGASYRGALEKFLGEKGFSSVPALGVVDGTRDFKTQGLKVKTQRPDAVFLLLYAGTGAAFLRDLRLADVSAAVYGSDNISSSEFTSAGGSVIEGVRVAMPAPAQSPKYEAFVARYRAKTGVAPDANVVKSYDAMTLAAHAIRNWGLDPERIGREFRSSQFSFDGVSGTIRFDEHGDLVGQEYTKMVYRASQLVPMR